MYKDSTVIPATVKARVSLRIVPEQDLDTIAANLQDHLNAEFNRLQSPNSLSVRRSCCSELRVFLVVLMLHPKQLSIEHTADWWLGKLDDPWFLALENAIRDEWGVEPLRIREGGVRLDSVSFYVLTLIAPPSLSPQYRI